MLPDLAIFLTAFVSPTAAASTNSTTTGLTCRAAFFNPLSFFPMVVLCFTWRCFFSFLVCLLYNLLRPLLLCAALLSPAAGAANEANSNIRVESNGPQREQGSRNTPNKKEGENRGEVRRGGGRCLFWRGWNRLGFCCRTNWRWRSVREHLPNQLRRQRRCVQQQSAAGVGRRHAPTQHQLQERFSFGVMRNKKKRRAVQRLIIMAQTRSIPSRDKHKTNSSPASSAKSNRRASRRALYRASCRGVRLTFRPENAKKVGTRVCSSPLGPFFVNSRTPPLRWLSQDDFEAACNVIAVDHEGWCRCWENQSPQFAHFT